MRENIFTLFATDINLFAQHLITKEELFNRFVGCVEMADELERKERKTHGVNIANWENESIDIPQTKERPYSNLDAALQMLR